jgi:DNA (cytosine-5)-methyltransferase 1
MRADDTFIQAPKVAGALTGGGHSGGLHSDMTTICVAQRGRNPENPSDRTTGAHTEQRLEPNSQGTTNTFTSVAKDNLIMVKSNTEKGFEEAKDGDSINFSNPSSKTRRGRVGKGKAQTLDTACNQGVFLSEPTHKHGEERIYKGDGDAPTIQSRYGTGGDNIPYVNNIRRLT